ncbi:MAG: thrombospondin type 3 repeat-containing protein, partial [Deltaproteobacteria bacterium]|nr:thrombospondin type 3 repeat-containing protein [Deltaproteobacteria bacterium]
CDGLDNDCDGISDDGLSVDADHDGHTTAASCTGSKDDCDDGDGAKFPGNPEVCDNKDNNCDGTVDDFSRATSCGTGLCSGNSGTETCTAGSWGGNTCAPLAGAVAEICDGLDNDCDGISDDGLSVDADHDGHTTAASCTGTKDDCDDNDGAKFPGNPEVCDNKDNNCDGTVDSFTRSTSCGVGICSGNSGVETCTSGSWANNTCNPLAGATAETCDTLDNDCDGTVDDGVTNACGTCGPAPDTDGDTVVDCLDNCRLAVNLDQKDCDHDGIGDLCDTASPCSNDDDLDGVTNDKDNCLTVPNSNQANVDHDLYGDACDSCPNDVYNDGDNDGICAGIGFKAPKTGGNDNCPITANTNQANLDGDLLGDACDACPNDVHNDADGDGICGDVDACPSDPDNDMDGDGVCGNVDNCPAVANASQTNADGDTLGDACDACVNDPANDADQDGICGNVDNCPAAANSGQTDGDSDGLGDVCDICPNDADNDMDGDLVCGDVDGCPADGGKSAPGQCGCGIADTDADADGVADCNDVCPHDAANDGDGDGRCADVDNCPSVANANQANADNDLYGDVCDVCPHDVVNDEDHDNVCGGSGFAAPMTGDNDNCPTTANPSQANADNDAFGDVCDSCPADANNDADHDGLCGDVDLCPNDANNDTDGDGVCGNVDNCPGAANPGQQNADGDLLGDACDACPDDSFNDADGDGICGNLDGCPNDAAKSEPGVCGCGVADVDSDGDGTLDCNDGCRLDPYKTAPGARGCGFIDDMTVPAGANVLVQPIPELSLIIDEITSACTLRVTVVNDAFHSSIYLPVGNKMYDIDLLCPQGPVTGNVCLQYEETDVTTNERDVRMLRNDLQGLKDVTFSLDADTDTVCGRTSSFTLFGAAEPKNSDGSNPDTVAVPAGTDVVVATPDAQAAVTLPSVDPGGCSMSVFVMDKPVPPVDYRLLGDKALDIDLECSPDGHVCLDYIEADVLGAEADLVLWHRGLNGWEDITESVDPVNNTICGYAPSFSPFAVGELSDYSGLHLIPYPSALSSDETDLEVVFDASRSSCYEEAYDNQGIAYPVELDCSFTWDFGGPGTVLGGNGDDIIVYRYDEVGSYTATVNMTEDVSGLTKTDTVAASAILVEPPKPTADFTMSAVGKTVTLKATGLPADIMRAYIYWGDRKRTMSSSPHANLAAGMAHTYAGSGSYLIRVTTLDTAHNELNYTFSEDGDLMVTLP